MPFSKWALCILALVWSKSWAMSNIVGCNTTAMPPKTKVSSSKQLQDQPVCLATPVAKILEHMQRLFAETEHGAELPLSLEANFFLLVLTLAHCRLGVTGAVGEMGASISTPGSIAGRGGLHQPVFSFQSLSLLRRANETLFVGGPFAVSSIQQADKSDLPLVPLQGWASALAAAGASGLPLRRISRLGGSDANDMLTSLTDLELLRRSDGVGFRVLRLDRAARGANETARLLRASVCALANGGLLLLEGIQGMSDRPGLQEGFHRFMLEQESAGSRGQRCFMPFLWAGRRGGIFLAEEEYVGAYRESIEQALPQFRRAIPESNQFYKVIDTTKFMYSSQVLSANWEAEMRDFEMLFPLIAGPALAG